jgi:ABC-type glutathione transport system ATPase component
VSGPLLRVEDLTIAMGRQAVVEEVSFEIAPGEMLGLVGESGCGKTVTALAIMQLVPNPPGRITGGRISYGGRDLVQLDAESLRRLRGDRIGMIFQEPMTSLASRRPGGRSTAIRTSFRAGSASAP